MFTGCGVNGVWCLRGVVFTWCSVYMVRCLQGMWCLQGVVFTGCGVYRVWCLQGVVFSL